jgi:hypothetical protein
MISQKTQLAIKVNEKDFNFQCEPQASLQEVYSALEQLKSYVYGRLKEAEDAQKAKDAQQQDEAPKPE